MKLKFSFLYFPTSLDRSTNSIQKDTKWRDFIITGQCIFIYIIKGILIFTMNKPLKVLNNLNIQSVSTSNVFRIFYRI